MTTNPRFKIFKPTTLATLTIAIVAASVTPSVMAQVPDHQLVLTENSSTSLTVTYDGSSAGITVANTSADNWTVIFPSNLFFIGEGAWSEPENNGALVNFPNFNDNGPTSVQSEVAFSGGNLFPDETTFVAFGIDTAAAGFFDVTFDDDASAAEASVPDTGSTFLLLFLALVALVSATRFRQLRLA